MKAILLLSLLFVCVFTQETTPVEHSNDIIDIVKCFLGKEELITDIKDIIEIIKSGDYSKLITIAFKVYADVTTAIKECVPQEQFEHDLKEPRSARTIQCVSLCRSGSHIDFNCVNKCRNQ